MINHANNEEQVRPTRNDPSPPADNLLHANHAVDPMGLGAEHVPVSNKIMADKVPYTLPSVREISRSL